jgi:hypothetical protein
MRSSVWIALLWLSVCFATAEAAGTAFEYPSGISDIYDAGNACWLGVGIAGEYVPLAPPEKWLVGAPPSPYSAVTFPVDTWVDLLFAGPIVPGDGNDVELLEWGMSGEEALVFLTDGDSQEYPVGLAKALSNGAQLVTYIDLKFPLVALPFVPRAIRIVAFDDKGMSPGFDLASVRAEVSHECGTTVSIPNPVSGAAQVRPETRLNWTPACEAKQDVVYLSTDESQVIAGAASARRSTQSSDTAVLDPCGLMLGRTYYWRVDEVLADKSVVPGPVWHFTVADRVLIDDFDAYGPAYLGANLDLSWPVPDSGPSGKNQAGRYVLTGDPIWYGCRQSLTFMYSCGSSYYSEIYHPFASPQRWLADGARVVQLWVYGDSSNTGAGQMYLSVTDSQGQQETTPFVIPDAMSLRKPVWTICRASLAGLSKVDLNSVQGIGIGFRLPAGASSTESSGTVHIDDITVHSTLCLDSERPWADTNGDCVVDYKDIRQMASQWLVSRTNMYPAAEPNAPILWYEFNNNTLDSAGGEDGQIEGRPGFVTGKYGQAIQFRDADDVVRLSPSRTPDLFARTRQAITISFWQISDDTPHLNNSICCSNYTYGQSDPSIAISLGCWKNPGQYRWDCGTPWSFANRLAGSHQDKLEWTGRWNHWVFTKDIRVGSAGARGRMEIYLNGVLYASRWGADAPIEGITSFEIGRGWYGHYNGLIDDFRIYDYALSPREVAYLASDGTGVLEATLPLSADLSYDGFVDFTDFAHLASQWLTDGLWP